MTRTKPVAESDRLLTPAETAEILGVDPKTLVRWLDKGWLSAIRTPGNHRRYREAEVRALAAELHAEMSGP